MEHGIKFQYPIGLPNTDDPLISEKVTNFGFFKLNKKLKLFTGDRGNFGKGEDHIPWEGFFSVK